MLNSLSNNKGSGYGDGDSSACGSAGCSGNSSCYGFVDYDDHETNELSDLKPTQGYGSGYASANGSLTYDGDGSGFSLCSGYWWPAGDGCGLNEIEGDY